MKYEVTYSRKPYLRYICVFFCIWWYTVNLQGSAKLDSRALEAVMVGYERGSRGSKVWNEEDRNVVVISDVVFD